LASACRPTNMLWVPGRTVGVHVWLRLGCAGSTLEPDRAVMDEKHQTKFPKKEATIVVTNRSRGKRWPHGFEEFGALMTSEKTKRFLAAI